MEIRNYNYNPAFNGDVILKYGKHPIQFMTTFRQNPVLKQLSEKGYDIIGTVKSKKASKRDINHDTGAQLYRILIRIRKENSLIDKFLCWLNLTPKTYLTKYYHTDGGTSAIINERITNSFVKKKFNIDLS